MTMHDETRPLPDVVRAGDIAFATTVRADRSLSSRPLTIAGVEPGVVWFLVDRTAPWAGDLGATPHVGLAVVRSRANDWVSLSGSARIETDESVVDRLWSPAASAYFADRHDPRLAALRVAVTDGEYWDAPGFGVLGRLVHVVSAAVGHGAEVGAHGGVRPS